MKDKFIPLAIVGHFVSFVAIVLVLAWYWQNYLATPKQPIEFPHYVHASNLNLDCQYCHQYADKSRYATVPAVKVCVDCHETTATDRPEVQKLLEYWKNKEPIPWVKVHTRFRKNANVGFQHKPHIRAGVDCTVCHGQVEMMTTARQTRTMDMGFCVQCHRANQAPTDCWTCHQ